ncbi:MAG: prephenate dehydrogenase [Vicingus serpentipes]|nr:prephenate dehydrogenase [Vicingus serpentipes]
MKVTIIGLGLMGGSLALALKESKFSSHIIGVDQNKTHCDDALRLQLVDEIKSLNEAIAGSNMIVVATPVAASISIISTVLNNITKDQVVVDLGSTKAELCTHLNQHQNRSQYVAAHPIAGTENSGPQSAINDLYKNKKVVICEKDSSTDAALSLTLKMFNDIGMSVVFMTPVEHDKHLAYISHLSHISSFALGLTVLDLEKDEKNIFNLAGSGFSSTARLAKSSPDMWESIVMQNKANILPAISAYIHHLEKLKKDIEENNSENLINSMKKANEIRKIIKN